MLLRIPFFGGLTLRLFWIAVPSLFVSTLYLSPLANADVMTLGSLSERATVNFDQDASAFADQISMSATPASASYSGSVTDPNVGVQFTASGKALPHPLAFRCISAVLIQLIRHHTQTELASVCTVIQLQIFITTLETCYMSPKHSSQTAMASISLELPHPSAAGCGAWQ